MAKQLSYTFSDTPCDPIAHTFVSLPWDQVNCVDDCFDDHITTFTHQNVLTHNVA